MKKFIAAIASLMVLTSVSAIAPLSVSADSVVAFEIGTVSTTGAVSDGKLVQEETVTVPVRVTENVGMTTFLLEFTQDSNIEIISFDSKKDDTEFTSGAFTKNIDALRVLWIDNSCSDVSLCGLLMNIQVKVPAGTPVGKYEVGFNESETQLTNVNFDSLEYTLTSGYIEVGGDSSSNPSSPQTPATTQAPQPVVTQAPVTNAPEPVVTQAPAATKAPTVSTAKPQAANPTTDAAANIAESETVSKTTLETTDETAITSSAASTDITSESIAESDVTANTSGSSAKPSNNNNNTANGNKNNTVTKTDKSPSTGATGVVIPSILLAASAVGVVAAASKKKKK